MNIKELKPGTRYKIKCEGKDSSCGFWHMTLFGTFVKHYGSFFMLTQVQSATSGCYFNEYYVQNKYVDTVEEA